MVTFSEYLGFSDSEEDQKKKPGKIKQFFKKHGKKIAIGAGLVGLGAAAYFGRNQIGAGLNKMKGLFKGNSEDKKEEPKTTTTPATTAQTNNKVKTTVVANKPKATQSPSIERGKGNTRFVNDNGNRVPVTHSSANGMTDAQVLETYKKNKENKERAQQLQAQANAQSRKAVMAKADKLFKKDSQAKANYVGRHLAREIKKNNKKNYLG